jgi:hypothetical protein
MQRCNLCCALIAVAFVWLTPCFASAAPPPFRPPPSFGTLVYRPRGKVVLFVMDGFSYRHVFPQGLSAFGAMGKWLEERGGMALLNTMGYGGVDRFRAAMTLACGVRAFGDETAAFVFDADEPLDADTAFNAYRRRVGDAPLPDASAPFKPLVFPMLAELRWRNERMQKKPLPFGVVAQSLRPKGVRLLAIGCGDPSLVPRASPLVPAYFRHGLLMALDEKGLGVGMTGATLLQWDATMPFGVAVNERRWEEAVAAAWRMADVLVLFPGETLRADLYGSERLLPKVIRRELGLLRPVVERMDLRRDLLLVFSLAPSQKSRYEHSFLFAVGKGIVAGSLLTSATTHQKGLVAILDIPATVLDFFGAEPFQPINGAPIRSASPSPFVPRPSSLLFGMGEGARITDGWWRVTALSVWCIAQGIVFAGLTILLLLRRPVPDGVLRITIGLAWLPVIVHLLSAGINASLTGKTMMAVGLLCGSGLLVVLTVGLTMRRRLGALVGATWVTAIVFAADALSSGMFSLNTPFGYSSFFGGRYYGLGNVGMGIALGSLFAIGLAMGWGRKGAALLGALGTVLVGAPVMGANIGGALTGVAMTASVLGWGRWRWRHVLVALLLTVTFLGIFAAIELMRPEPLTHWGRFVHAIAQEGLLALGAMVWTKLGISLRAFRAIHWDFAWAMQGALLAVLWWAGERDWRWGGLVIGSLAALLLNDSGPQTPVAFAFLPMCVMAVKRFQGSLCK